MAEYIVKVPDEDAEHFIARFGFDETTLFGYHLTGEIVYCRDCRHYMKTFYNVGVCHPLGISFADMDDGFCAWAERRCE